ncbi:MAG: deoxyribonuclease V [Armatimonadota bacterium]
MANPELAHPWHLSVRDAEAVQRALAPLVEAQDRLPSSLQTVCGVDVSNSRFSSRVVASAVLLTYPGLDVAAETHADMYAAFPYVPGLLAFRELPAVLAALERLPQTPDLVIVDGHGFSHPRRFGIACHLGVLTNIPTIGCAKSLLVGQVSELGTNAGARAPIQIEGTVVGYALRTRSGAKPVFVSTGHRVSPETAVQIVLSCCRGFRLPEPIRAAHAAAGRARLCTDSAIRACPNEPA